MTEHIIAPAEILLPGESIDMQKWPALACDQFTSQPEYWQAAERFVGGAPSALHLVLPEVYLEDADVADRIAAIHGAMDDALRGVLTRAVHGFVYTERRTESGTRPGLVCALDLEAYSYAPGAEPLIRPTEGTVTSRIPPRLAVRRGAALELPHILMLLDDPEDTVLGPIAAAKASLQKLYDTELMLGGGSVSGWAVDEQALIEGALAAIDRFAATPGPGGRVPIAIAAGDGNHSLATAKAYWEELKVTLSPEEAKTHPARYALAELENIHSPAILIEPIHRVVFGIEKPALKAALAAYFGDSLGSEGEQWFTLIGHSPADDERLWLRAAKEPLCAGSIEAFLGDFLPRHPECRVDYIHGEGAVRTLCTEGACGILLPPFEKDDLFKGVYLGGVLPRKTFSMGHAEEKRYYLESRRIQK